MLLTLGIAALLVACSTSPDSPHIVDPPAHPHFTYDTMGCLEAVDHRTTTPLALSGRLVVTYYEPSLADRMCEWDDETSTYWCREETRVAPDCEDVEGTFYCPMAAPPADRLGDPQEMGIFDSTRPEMGVDRWTDNLVHEAEIDVSPDGTQVVYAVRSHLDAFDVDQGMGIWVVNIDGSDPRRLTMGDGYAGIPTWVPPGNDRFTFIQDDSAGASGLFVFDIGTMTATEIVHGFGAFAQDPEASHDGSLITFKADPEDGNVPSIYVMQFDGSGVRRLTTGFSDHDPVFSRDNARIYFERYYGTGEWDQYAELDRSEHPEINQWGIVGVDVESMNETVIIPHDPCGKHFFWLPTVSPDGDHLMFIHDYVEGDEGYQDLWVSELDGANAQSVENTREIYWFDWTN